MIVFRSDANNHRCHSRSFFSLTNGIGTAHGLRNEMHIYLKRLHKRIQCSHFFLAREQRYLCLLKTGESRKLLSSHITGELNLVAQPVGTACLLVSPLLGGWMLVLLSPRIARNTSSSRTLCTGIPFILFGIHALSLAFKSTCLPKC